MKPLEGYTFPVPGSQFIAWTLFACRISDFIGLVNVASQHRAGHLFGPSGIDRDVRMRLSYCPLLFFIRPQSNCRIPVEASGFRNSSGNFAIFAAIRRASSREQFGRFNVTGSNSRSRKKAEYAGIRRYAPWI